MQPRLVGSLAPQLSKTPTGIPGLDEGPARWTPCRSANPGCGKTLLGMTFLVNGATVFGEPGVFGSFEDTSQDLARATVSWWPGLRAPVNRPWRRSSSPRACIKAKRGLWRSSKAAGGLHATRGWFRAGSESGGGKGHTRNPLPSSARPFRARRPCLPHLTWREAIMSSAASVTPADQTREFQPTIGGSVYIKPGTWLGSRRSLMVS